LRKPFEIIASHPILESHRDSRVNQYLAARRQFLPYPSSTRVEQLLAIMGVIAGVDVSVDIGASPKTRNAAAELTRQLNAIHIATKLRTNKNPHPTDKIYITAGIKP
ncbi:MAG: hypothetical protein ACREFD_05165, partial [Stellaceae bacterium]